MTNASADVIGLELRALARRVDAARAARLEAEIIATDDPQGTAASIGVLLGTCFPALSAPVSRYIGELQILARQGWHTSRDREPLLSALRAEVAAAGPEAFARSLRRFAWRERARVALREVLPRALGGADVDVTAAELSHLADATAEVALEEATSWATARYGTPVTDDGRPSTFVVLGMGKLGGLELNAGSDIDLIYFYDTDDGRVIAPVAPESGSASDAVSLHELWLRVARRLTASLDEATEDGFVWRVDLRLRPEGGAGPLVNSLAAAERYYESFGRLWERAALLRGRPIAGDLALGERLLGALESFVWRRRIDPTIAKETTSLVIRSRAELSHDPDRDLKLGPGGIREAEFFVQTLQLVWGGRHPELRPRGTLEALGRLESKGFCTVREAEEISDAYVALRRAEHAVQFATGVQTHVLPAGPELRLVARALGFDDERAFVADLARHRRRVEKRFASLLPTEGRDRDRDQRRLARWAEVLAPLDRRDEAALVDALRRALSTLADARRAAKAEAEEGSDDELRALAKNLLDLGKHPDALLGVRTRETFPGLDETVLDALFEAPDPMQAVRYLRVFFDRVKQPAVYVRLVFADPPALRRLVAALGASAFIGDALANNPELGDVVLFSREVVTPEAARREVLAAADVQPRAEEDPEEALIGALRLAKTRLTVEVALGDLAGALGVRDVNLVLTAVADASLEVAAMRALGATKVDELGLSVLAMGKLGGREISYGSDLDVIFVYDPTACPDPLEAPAHFTRAARKIIRAISTFHGAGPGYDLDARLRPSGNQGLLVTSLDAFARYHGVSAEADESPKSAGRAAVWERMALTRVRAAAGDPELGARAVAIARGAALGLPGNATAGLGEEVHRIRARVETEASRERPGVHDLKLGPGGLLDIEFAVQFLLIRHGARLGPNAPLAETPLAIDALASIGAMSAEDARVLQEAYAFLRRLELRIRVVRADASHILEVQSPAMVTLARRMKMRDHPTKSAEERLIVKYRETARQVRTIYRDILFSGA